MNDVRKVIYGTIIGFFMMLSLWFSIIFISSCGFTFTCHQAALTVERTPIPTLIPVSHSDSDMEMGAAEFDKCQIVASDLVGAWVSADTPESEPFTFTDVNDQSCEGTYVEDVQPLFVDNGIWQARSLGCVSCHNADLSNRSAGLDLTSFDVLTSASVLGGNWESSTLYKYLGMSLTADGHSTDSSAENLLIFAGTQLTGEEDATPAP